MPVVKQPLCRYWVWKSSQERSFHYTFVRLSFIISNDPQFQMVREVVWAKWGIQANYYRFSPQEVSTNQNGRKPLAASPRNKQVISRPDRLNEL